MCNQLLLLRAMLLYAGLLRAKLLPAGGLLRTGRVLRSDNRMCAGVL
jgi:hypothetical protein